jgi:thiol:disulfide interchange protein
MPNMLKSGMVLSLFVLAIGVALMGSRIFAPKEIVPWHTDYDAASRQAIREGKPLFLDFTASWCGPCQSLKSSTWADKSVAAELTKYVVVQIDVDAHPDLARKYDAQAIPAFFVVDPRDNQIVKSSVGALRPEEFLHWIRSDVHAGAATR